MEESKHITYFKVENFKRFESFEMENIGQFNLIVGDNNVGKTTVLESLLFDKDINDYFDGLQTVLAFRFIKFDVIEANEHASKIFEFYYNQNRKSSEILYSFRTKDAQQLNTLSYRTANKTSLTEQEVLKLQTLIIMNPSKVDLILSNYNGNQISDFPDYNKSDGYIPFIHMNVGYADYFAEYYSEKIQPSSNRKKNLIEDINLFIPEIWDIEISSAVIENQNFIVARHTGFDKLLPITMFGEGSIRLLGILLEINMCENGRLMVDEIDTGIYHGRFKKFWKVILLSAKRNNVQLFATTHNQECLEFIKEVLEEDEELKDFQKDMRCFRLVEQKDKSVKSYCYDYEKFQFAIDHENEIR